MKTIALFYSFALLSFFFSGTLEGKDYSIVYQIGKSNYTLNSVLPEKGELKLAPLSYALIMDSKTTSYVEVYNESSSKEKKYKLDSLLKIAEHVKGNSELLKYSLSVLKEFSTTDASYAKISHNPNLYRCPMSIYTIAPQKCTLYNDEVFIQWTHVKKNKSTYRVEVTNLFDDPIFKSLCKGNFLSFTFNDNHDRNYIFRTRRLLHPNEECQDDIMLVRLAPEKRASIKEMLILHGCDSGGPFSTVVEIQIYSQMDLFMDANIKWQYLTSYTYIPNLAVSYKKFLVDQKVAIVWRSDVNTVIEDAELFVYFE